MRPDGRRLALVTGSALLITIAAGQACSSASGPIGPTDGPRSPAPGGVVRRFDLTAEIAAIELKPGLRISAWTYNGSVPGPVLRAEVGDLVVVVLHNRLPQGTTIHWHGLAVPNGEDGVAGVTQDPVPPGQTETYAFIASESGTYWYHSHNEAASQVDRGLYGALVITPRGGEPAGLTDVTLVYDDWPLALEVSPPPPADDFTWISYVTDTVNGKTGAAIRPISVSPGAKLRLRLVNAGATMHFVHVDGASVRIVAFDGHEVEGGPPTDDALPLGPAQRLDVVLTAPARPTWLRLEDALPPAAEASVPLVPPGQSEPEQAPPPVRRPNALLDVFRYPARALASPWPSGGSADVAFTLHLSVAATVGKPPSLDGQLYEINGKTFPATGTLDVRTGQLVAITFVNDSRVDHPMHLHGHAFQVLAVDGRPPDGVLVMDTVVVGPRQTVTVGFRADNPGWWMIHCHELYHSRGGMMILLHYIGAPRLADIGGRYAGHPD